MAINTTEKALDLANHLASNAKVITDTINDAVLDIADVAASTIDFTTVDFTATNLKYLDGAALNAAIGVLQAIDTYLAGLSAGAGSPTRRALLLKVRRG